MERSGKGGLGRGVWGASGLLGDLGRGVRAVGDFWEQNSVPSLYHSLHSPESNCYDTEQPSTRHCPDRRASATSAGQWLAHKVTVVAVSQTLRDPASGPALLPLSMPRSSPAVQFHSGVSSLAP